MKKIIMMLISLNLIFVCSCSEDSSGTVTDPFGTGGTGGQGGGTGSVTFKIGNQLVQEGYDFDGDGQSDNSFYLTASPSVSVKINSVQIGVPDNANFDSVQGDGTSVFNANQEVYLNTTPYYNVSSGQKFTIKFSGKLAADDQAFEVTVEFTVP